MGGFCSGQSNGLATASTVRAPTAAASATVMMFHANEPSAKDAVAKKTHTALLTRTTTAPLVHLFGKEDPEGLFRRKDPRWEGPYQSPIPLFCCVRPATDRSARSHSRVLQLRNHSGKPNKRNSGDEPFSCRAGCGEEFRLV
jgi:hypothetical protein